MIKKPESMEEALRLSIEHWWTILQLRIAIPESIELYAPTVRVDFYFPSGQLAFSIMGDKCGLCVFLNEICTECPLRCCGTASLWLRVYNSIIFQDKTGGVWAIQRMLDNLIRLYAEIPEKAKRKGHEAKRFFSDQ